MLAGTNILCWEEELVTEWEKCMDRAGFPLRIWEEHRDRR